MGNLHRSRIPNLRPQVFLVFRVGCRCTGLDHALPHGRGYPHRRDRRRLAPSIWTAAHGRTLWTRSRCSGLAAASARARVAPLTLTGQRTATNCCAPMAERSYISAVQRSCCRGGCCSLCNLSPVCRGVQPIQQRRRRSRRGARCMLRRCPAAEGIFRLLLQTHNVHWCCGATGIAPMTR